VADGGASRSPTQEKHQIIQFITDTKTPGHVLWPFFWAMKNHGKQDQKKACIIFQYDKLETWGTAQGGQTKNRNKQPASAQVVMFIESP
jgi:hypothetical protein